MARGDSSTIDTIVLEIRKRMRAGWTREQIIIELHVHVPSGLLFLCYNAAAIMERDYGRQIP
jgi:hypothetical protein